MGRNCGAEYKALNFVTAVLLQIGKLFDRLDPLGNDAQPKAMTKSNDGIGNRLIFRILSQIADKRTVNL